MNVNNLRKEWSNSFNPQISVQEWGTAEMTPMVQRILCKREDLGKQGSTRMPHGSWGGLVQDTKWLGRSKRAEWERGMPDIRFCGSQKANPNHNGSLVLGCRSQHGWMALMRKVWREQCWCSAMLPLAGLLQPLRPWSWDSSWLHFSMAGQIFAHGWMLLWKSMCVLKPWDEYIREPREGQEAFTQGRQSYLPRGVSTCSLWESAGM